MRDYSLSVDEGADEILRRFGATVPKSIAEKMGDGELSADFTTLVGEVLSVFSSGGGAVGSFFLFAIGLAILIALGGLASGKMSRISEYAISSVAGVILFSRLSGVVDEICRTVGGVLSFCASAIPILASAVAYGGGAGSSGVGLSGANLTLGIIGGAVLPMLNSCALLIFALGLVSTGTDSFSGLSKRVRNFFMWLVGLSSTLLLSALSLQSAIASSADTATVRAAKYAASGAIPIVGGSVSAAMGTLLASVGYIKGVIGVGSISVILLTVLSPLATLLLYRLAISVGEGLLELVGVGFGVRLYSSFKAALDTLIAVFVLSVTVLILEIVILMKSGVRSL